jgi:hypothetical protein
MNEAFRFSRLHQLGSSWFSNSMCQALNVAEVWVNGAIAQLAMAVGTFSQHAV